jgi:hypothetical protein
VTLTNVMSITNDAVGNVGTLRLAASAEAAVEQGGQEAEVTIKQTYPIELPNTDPPLDTEAARRAVEDDVCANRPQCTVVAITDDTRRRMYDRSVHGRRADNHVRLEVVVYPMISGVATDLNLGGQNAAGAQAVQALVTFSGLGQENFPAATPETEVTTVVVVVEETAATTGVDVDSYQPPTTEIPMWSRLQSVSLRPRWPWSASR